MAQSLSLFSQASYPAYYLYLQKTRKAGYANARCVGSSVELIFA